MQELLLFLMISISFTLGHVVATGKWKEKYTSLDMSTQTHIESLKILLDESVAITEKDEITINVLTSEIRRLKEGNQ
jgi:hypothetical protein